MERRGDGGIGGAQDPQMESMFGNRDFQPLPTENPQSEEWRDLLELFKKIVLALLPVYTAFNLAGLAGAFVSGESNVIKAVILICTVLFLLYANVALMVIHAAERQTSVNAIDIAAFMVFILIEYIVPYSGLLLCKLVHVPVSIVCTVGLVLAIVIFICWCFTIKHPMIFVKYIPCIAREAFPAGQEPSLQGTISPEEDLVGHAHQSVAPQQSQQSSRQPASAGQEPSSQGTISPEEDLEGHAHHSVATEQSPERQAHAVYQAVTAADTRTASTEP